MKEVTVRIATEADCDAIVRLWREMADLHAEIEPMVWTLRVDADEHYRRHLTECLGDPDCRVFVALHGNEVVGYLLAAKAKRPPVLDPATQGAIHDTCVTRAARRSGIGERLVAAAMDWFRSEGLPLATVGHALGNRASSAFWRAQGFRAYQASCVRPVAVPTEPAGTAFDDTRPYFAAVAETYDRLHPIVAGPGYHSGMTMVADLVPYESDEPFTVLELGCGTATLTVSVLDQFPRAHAIAIDGEPAMLEVAKRKLAAYGGRAEVMEADVLTCELSACDLVLLSFICHHLPPEGVTEMLGRIAHALRPGGCLLLLDQMTAGPIWGELLGAQRRRLHQRHVANAIAAGVTTQQEIDARWALKRKMRKQGKDVEYRHSAEQLTEATHGAGFSEVGMVWRLFASTILMAFMPEGGA